MRTLPGLLLALALLLTGCGDDDATDPAAGDASSSGTPSGGSGPVDATLVALVSQTAVGGEVSTTAAPLGDDAAVAEFSAQFEGDAMQQSIQQAIAVATVPDGTELMGAVVDVGCTPPEDVDVAREDGEVTITAVPAKETKQECLAPVTTVALVAVDQATV